MNLTGLYLFRNVFLEFFALISCMLFCYLMISSPASLKYSAGDIRFRIFTVSCISQTNGFVPREASR